MAKSPTPNSVETQTEIAPVVAVRDTKLSRLIKRLRAPDGASLDELVALTSWQKHSIRGVMSGALKKKLGLTIISAKTEQGRFYRIVAAGNEAGEAADAS